MTDATLIMQEVERRGLMPEFLKYNENHAPAGSPDGGQFTSGDGGGGDTSSVARPLTGLEQHAVEFYKNTGFSDINAKLRAGKEADLSQHQKDVVSALDRLIGENTLATDTTVFRAIDGKRAGDKYMKAGTTVLDRAFLSTSNLESRALRANADVAGRASVLTVIEIRVPAGTHAFDLQSYITASPFGIHSQGNEGELLFGRNVRIEIISVNIGTRHIIARIVHVHKSLGYTLLLKEVRARELWPAYQERLKGNDCHNPAGDSTGGQFCGGEGGGGGGGGSDTTETEVVRQERLAAAQTNPLAHPEFVLGMVHDVSGETSRYVAAYGQEFLAAPLPNDIKRGASKECYRNASLLVMQHNDLTYAEGFAETNDLKGLKFMHAWAVRTDGTVVDNTWTNPEKGKYFGVKYDRDKYLKYLFTAKIYGVLGSTYKNALRAIKTGGEKLR